MLWDVMTNWDWKEKSEREKGGERKWENRRGLIRALRGHGKTRAFSFSLCLSRLLSYRDGICNPPSPPSRTCDKGSLACRHTNGIMDFSSIEAFEDFVWFSTHIIDREWFCVQSVQIAFWDCSLHTEMKRVQRIRYVMLTEKNYLFFLVRFSYPSMIQALLQSTNKTPRWRLISTWCVKEKIENKILLCFEFSIKI